jgi:hypothetical protein
MNKLNIARCIFFLLFLVIVANQLSVPAHATLPYSKDTGKKCYYCHANKIGEKCVLSEQGVYWITHSKSFEGMSAELIAGPPEPEKVKNTPFIAMILGPIFFFGIVAMIIIGIVKKPAAIAHEVDKPSSDTKIQDNDK